MSLGIDLAPAGPNNPVDSQDTDTGANDKQNQPVVLSVTSGVGTTIVSGYITGRPNITHFIDLYASPSCDSSGFGEGQTHIHRSGTIGTNETGYRPFTEAASYVLPPGHVVTATTTSTGAWWCDIRVLAVHQPVERL